MIPSIRPVCPSCRSPISPWKVILGVGRPFACNVCQAKIILKRSKVVTLVAFVALYLTIRWLDGTPYGLAAVALLLIGWAIIETAITDVMLADRS